MSRHFVTCTEVTTYGNQQEDGLSRREDNMFFAFANGIFHTIDGVPRFDPVNELGVVTHNKKELLFAGILYYIRWIRTSVRQVRAYFPACL